VKTNTYMTHFKVLIMSKLR